VNDLLNDVDTDQKNDGTNVLTNYDSRGYSHEGSQNGR